jgi:hypothetical protein
MALTEQANFHNATKEVGLGKKEREKAKPVAKKRSTSDGYMPSIYKKAKGKVAENIKKQGGLSDKEVMDKYYYNTPKAKKAEKALLK